MHTAVGGFKTSGACFFVLRGGCAVFRGHGVLDFEFVITGAVEHVGLVGGATLAEF